MRARYAIVLFFIFLLKVLLINELFPAICVSFGIITHFYYCTDVSGCKALCAMNLF